MQKGRKYNTFARKSLPPAAVLLSRRFVVSVSGFCTHRGSRWGLSVSISGLCAHRRSRWGPTVSVSGFCAHGRRRWRTPSRYAYRFPPRWRQTHQRQKGLRRRSTCRQSPKSTYGAKPIRHRASSGAHNLDATLANCSGSPPGLSSAAPLLLPFPEPLLRPATQSSPNPKNTFNPKNIAFRAKNVGFRVFRFFSGFFVYMFAARFHSEYSFFKETEI